MSHFTNKSDIYLEVAEMAESKYKYPAVAHCAYYSCLHWMQHIWYYKMRKTKQDLDLKCSTNRTGEHSVLINEIAGLIKGNPQNKNARNDFQAFNNKIIQLRKLRVDADYSDKDFGMSKSSASISLAKDILPILKRA